MNLLREALIAEGIHTQIIEVLVADEKMAAALKFGGSPTIRINGLDVAEDPASSGTLTCRLYPGSQQTGVPPVAMLRRAIANACVPRKE